MKFNNLGMLLLAIFVILASLPMVGVGVIPLIVTGIVGIIAGILLLIGK